MFQWRAILLGCAAALLVGLGTSPVALSGPADLAPGEAAVRGLAWRNVGPFTGGRSIAVAGSPKRRDEYYFGATGGGLWKTTDGGTTWNPTSDGFFKSSSVGAVAVCATNPDVVYAGMGEVQFRNDILQGDGIYKSTDAGATWTHMGLADSQAISRIRIDPSDCNRVYAAAMGHPFGRNEERGVFRSTDGGQNWTRVLYRNSQAGAADLVMDPNNPSVLYAGLWYAYRRPWTGWSGGPDSGLYKSTDGGNSWTDVTRRPGLPTGLVGKVGVAVSGADSNRVYAIFDAEQPGIYSSDDAGATWTKVNDQASLTQRPAYYTRIYADPKARDTVYVLTDDLWKSTNGGRTFQSIRAPHGDHHDLWIDPTDTTRLIDSNDGGANVSVNGGATWTAQDYPTAQMYHVMTTNDDPYLICGSQQDRSAVCVPSDGTGTGSFSPGGGESGYIASDPRDPNIFYAGNYGGYNFTRFDRRLPFQRRRIDVWPEVPFGNAPKDLRERFFWTFPIATTPAFPQAVYVSSQHLFRTTNGGQSWDRVSPDLTRADPATLGRPGGPIYMEGSTSETYGTIFAVAPSNLDRKLIWVGSDDGLIHVTRTGGDRWTNITPRDLPPFTRVSLIEASPHDPATAYVAAKRDQLDDRAPYLYKTHDYGRTWRKIVDGIAGDDFVHAVREDPVRQGLLYAGTEHGVYVSFDDGGSWQSLRQNLPDVSVQDLVVKGDDLVIATHGRGFYVMDGISALRNGQSKTQEVAVAPPKAAEAAPATATLAQADPPKVGSTFELSDPVDPIRLVDSGVRVAYTITQPAQQATMDFLDDRGNVIRSLTGSQVPTTAGDHAVTWNLRYPGASVFDGLVMLFVSVSNGPRAPWGTYQVRLTVDGESLTQSFEIKGDPRLTEVSPSDIREQFRLAMAVNDRTSEAHEAVAAIRSCRDQVNDRVAQADDDHVSRSGARLAEALGAREQTLYQTRLAAGDDEGHWPTMINNELFYLLPIIESAESRPTDQTYEVFDELSQRLDGRLAAVDALFHKGVDAFNRLLRKRDLGPITCSRKEAS